MIQKTLHTHPVAFVQIGLIAAMALPLLLTGVTPSYDPALTLETWGALNISALGPLPFAR